MRVIIFIRGFSIITSGLCFSFLISCTQQKQVHTSVIIKPLAFPGAEGFGKYTSGGRGGKIIIVSNLNDKGIGSFREAVTSNEKKIVLFAISGKQLNVQLIDLDKKSQELLQQFGAENSKWLYNQLEPGEHPNYPAGVKDNTHFSELGARKMAEIVLAEIKTLSPDLAKRIVKPVKK